MQKTILASVIIMSLSACDSDSLSLTTEDGAVNSTGNTAVSDTAVSNTVVATDSTATDSNTGTTVVANNETTTGGTTVVVQTPISDDAGSSTSDGEYR